MGIYSSKLSMFSPISEQFEFGNDELNMYKIHKALKEASSEYDELCDELYFHEFQFFSECGVEKVYTEGAIGNIISKIIEAIKSFFRKIKEFLSNIFNKTKTNTKTVEEKNKKLEKINKQLEKSVASVKKDSSKFKKANNILEKINKEIELYKYDVKLIKKYIDNIDINEFDLEDIVPEISPSQLETIDMDEILSQINEVSIDFKNNILESFGVINKGSDISDEELISIISNKIKTKYTAKMQEYEPHEDMDTLRNKLEKKSKDILSMENYIIKEIKDTERKIHSLNLSDSNENKAIKIIKASSDTAMGFMKLITKINASILKLINECIAQDNRILDANLKNVSNAIDKVANELGIELMSEEDFNKIMSDPNAKLKF